MWLGLSGEMRGLESDWFPFENDFQVTNFHPHLLLVPTNCRDCSLEFGPWYLNLIQSPR
jgi:hypothetical protein